MMVDALAANATGVYSGVDVSGNEASFDTTNLCGLQATDFDGVASFDIIFPGHYKGTGHPPARGFTLQLHPSPEQYYRWWRYQPHWTAVLR